MGEYAATIRWQGDPQAAYARGQYSRVHEWHFDGGSVVRASASPKLVRAPWSAADAVDPEEAFVAALSSCHMLWFLSIAAGAGFVVERYEDDAVGRMAADAAGRIGFTEVVLRPRVAFAGTPPDASGIEALHAQAHASCFIAHSVTARVRIESGDGAAATRS